MVDSKGPITFEQVEWACKVVKRPIGKRVTDRNWEIFVRHVQGESKTSLSNEFKISASRTQQICSDMSRYTRRAMSNPSYSVSGSDLYLRPSDDLKRRLDMMKRKELQYANSNR